MSNDTKAAASLIASIIAEARRDQDLTQDQFGQKFGVSGPAVFKFEKGYVHPSLPLWLKIADEFGMERLHAVRIWCADKLPNDLRRAIDVAPPPEPGDQKRRKEHKAVRAFFETPSIQLGFHPSEQERATVAEILAPFPRVKVPQVQALFLLVRDLVAGAQ